MVPAHTAPADYEVVQLKNGSFSLRSRSYGETYHPVIGPVAEANALYVEQLRLVERLKALVASGFSGPLVIWDVGLGAAANILTVLSATREIKLDLEVVSFDFTTQPLIEAQLHPEKFCYLEGYQKACHELIADRSAQFRDGARAIHWELVLGDFPTFLASEKATELPKPHAILFDAFSPKKNPEMWTLPLFTRIFELLDPTQPCALPTYSRSTLLRVTLLLAGFYVGYGSRTGEKEETTIAANAKDLIEQPLSTDWLLRVKKSTSAEPLRSNSYQQRPLSAESWAKLIKHPQFQ